MPHALPPCTLLACPQIAAVLHPAGRQLVLAVSPLVPAPGRQAQLSERDVEELLEFVDGLSGELQVPGGGGRRVSCRVGWGWEATADETAVGLEQGRAMQRAPVLPQTVAWPALCAKRRCQHGPSHAHHRADC